MRVPLSVCVCCGNLGGFLLCKLMGVFYLHRKVKNTHVYVFMLAHRHSCADRVYLHRRGRAAATLSK